MPLTFLVIQHDARHGSTTDFFGALYLQLCLVVHYTVRWLADISAVGD